VRRRKGFTLVELLVVIGIIALLISILMPALSRVRDQANRIKCMSNVRTIMQGIVMYCSQNKSYLPYANWGGNPLGTPGWLYDNSQWPTFNTDASDGLPAWSYFEDGAIERLLKSREVFKCPLHIERVTEFRPGGSGITEKYTSYLMNGVSQDYGGPPYPVTRYKVEDIIIWETGETDLAGRILGIPPFNDGSSQPLEWLSERHGAGGRDIMTGQVRGNGGASIGCVDGHVEWYSYKDYQKEIEKHQQQPLVHNRLYCSPTLPNGG
jgi:prepilin-type N-terminal cleavage/methylation domain-containing protein